MECQGCRRSSCAKGNVGTVPEVGQEENEIIFLEINVKYRWFSDMCAGGFH
jgi:hypothetical protein